MIFVSDFLDFWRSFAYHLLKLRSLQISLLPVVNDSDVGCLKFPNPAHPPQDFSSSDRPSAGASCGAACVPSNPFSGFAVASRRADSASLSWRPGTHPRRMRSAAF